MPEWILNGLIFVVLVGLIVALRKADQEHATERFDRLVERFEALEQWKKDKEVFDYSFRHNDYAQTIKGINEELWPLVNKVEQCEKLLAKLDKKIFNGHEQSKSR